MSVLNTIGAASIKGFQNPDVVNGPVLQQKITSPLPLNNGAFGFSISATDDGSRIVIGQPGGGGMVGYAFVFVKSGDQWISEATLTDATVNSGFGFSCDISGDGNYLIVGATDLGRAYIYVRSGSTWSLQFTAGSGSGAGRSVSINQDGTYAAYGASSGAGRVVILTRSGTIWTVQANFPGTGARNLGSTVRLNDAGNKLIIGFRSPAPGAVPTFTYRTGTTWSPDPATTSFLVGGPSVVGDMPLDFSKDGLYAVYGGVSAPYDVAMYSVGTGAPAFIGDVVTNTELNGLTSLSLNYDATKLLLNNSYYIGSGASWTLAQSYVFPAIPGLFVTPTISCEITSDGVYNIFGRYEESTSQGAVYIFNS
jgi:hypothetical protein